MTWSIAIDESGNLGKDSRYFVMAAIVTMRQRNLLPVVKLIPTYREVSKFYNSTDSEITTILEGFAKSNATVSYVLVDKHDYKSEYYGLNGNDLYLKVLQRLLNLAFESISGDVNVYLDRSTFIPLQTFRKITGEISLQKGCNLKKCDKVTSHQNRCVQIADYVAGAINYNFRNNDSTFMDLIKERIRCP